jgi:N-acetylglucosamine-6-phosphate deacetylase
MDCPPRASHRSREVNSIAIQNGEVVLPDRSIPGGTVVIVGGRIGHAGKRCKTPRGAVEIDACGGYVTPGLIDVHIHGASLVGWETCTRHGLEQVSETLLANGILRFVPTMMADESVLRRMAGLLATASCRTRVPGLYVEGPFVNLQKKGGIQEKYIGPVNMGYLKQLQRIAKGRIRMMTFAPELDGAAELPAAMRSLGILPCVGHSMARADQAEAVCGRRQVGCTHLYNAMSGLDHHEPGLAAFALNQGQVYVELNPDGTHVAPELLQVTWRAKPANRIVLISDAVMTAGAEPGIYEYMNRKIHSTEKGAYYLESGTLVGSTVLLNRGLQRFITFTEAPVHEAVRMASLNPATLLGLGRRAGSLEVGKSADVVVFSRDFAQVQAVFWKGRKLLPRECPVERHE